MEGLKNNTDPKVVEQINKLEEYYKKLALAGGAKEIVKESPLFDPNALDIIHSMAGLLKSKKLPKASKDTPAAGSVEEKDAAYAIEVKTAVRGAKGKIVSAEEIEEKDAAYARHDREEERSKFTKDARDYVKTLKKKDFKNLISSIDKAKSYTLPKSNGPGKGRG